MAGSFDFRGHQIFARGNCRPLAGVGDGVVGLPVPCLAREKWDTHLPKQETDIMCTPANCRCGIRTHAQGHHVSSSYIHRLIENGNRPPNFKLSWEISSVVSIPLAAPPSRTLPAPGNFAPLFPLPSASRLRSINFPRRLHKPKKSAYNNGA